MSSRWPYDVDFERLVIDIVCLFCFLSYNYVVVCQAIRLLGVGSDLEFYSGISLRFSTGTILFMHEPSHDKLSIGPISDSPTNADVLVHTKICFIW